jgi:hypothetical protein
MQFDIDPALADAKDKMLTYSRSRIGKAVVLSCRCSELTSSRPAAPHPHHKTPGGHLTYHGHTCQVSV